MQQSLKQCFIDVEFDVLEWNTLFTNWRQGAKHPSANSAQAINVSYAAMDPFFAMVRFTSTTSVRAPASHCGLVGLRPTHGRVSLASALDLSPSLDTCGWFARDVPTFARVADVLLGEDANPLPEQVRLLAPIDLWALAMPLAKKALAPARQQVEAVLGPAGRAQVVLEDLDAMYWHFRHIQSFEAWQVDGGFIRRFAPPLGPGVAERFAWSAGVTDAQVAAGRLFRDRFRQHLSDLLGHDGVLLLPTMPDVAPRRDAPEAALEDYRNRSIRLLCASGLSGFPQLSLPLAKRDGAPLGISLLGPAGSDRSLVRLAERIVTAAD